MTGDTKPLRFLRLHDVLQKVGLHKTQIYSLMAEGRFPRPVQLTAGTVAWVEHEVESWMRNRIAERMGNGGSSGGPADHSEHLRAG